MTVMGFSGEYRQKVVTFYFHLFLFPVFKLHLRHSRFVEHQMTGTGLAADVHVPLTSTTVVRQSSLLLSVGVLCFSLHHNRQQTCCAVKLHYSFGEEVFLLF